MAVGDDRRGGARVTGRARTAGSAEGAERQQGGHRPLGLAPLLWIGMVAATLPIVVAAVRVVRGGWLAIGDNAILLVRSRDVLTEHHPLLGTRTSASTATGEHINNPGPLYWDLLALPAKALGHPGMVVGVAVLNIAAVVGAVLVARRRAGDLGALCVAVMAAALVWALGTELVVDPWQPNALVLPFLCFLVLTWSLAAGDWPILPAVAGVGSFLVQTHLSFVYLVGGLSLFGVMAGWVAMRRPAWVGASPSTRPDRRAQARTLGVTALVLAVAWSQPVWEQLSDTGTRGNLRRLLGASLTGDREGLGLGARLVADTVALPPWWGRPSYTQYSAIGVDPQPAGAAAAAVGLAVVAALLAGAAWWGRRSGRAVTVAGAATAATATVLAVATVALIPRNEEYGFAIHYARWIWPISAFTTGVLLHAAVSALDGSPVAHRLGPVVAGIAVVLAVLALPYCPAGRSSFTPARAQAVAKDLVAQLDDFRTADVVLVDTGLAYFGSLVQTNLVMAELQGNGVRFVVADEYWVRQLGEGRRFEGQADVRLFLEGGLDALDVPTGARRIALAGLAAGEEAELGALTEEVGLALDTAVVRLAPRCAEELRALTRALGGAVEGGSDPRANPLADVDRRTVRRLVVGGRLAGMLAGGCVAIDGVTSGAARLLGHLQEHAEAHALGVFIEPLHP